MGELGFGILLRGWYNIIILGLLFLVVLYGVGAMVFGVVMLVK